MWDAATGKETACLSRHEHLITGLAWRPDGGAIASASADDTVRIWTIPAAK